jgi:ParB family chromosome partitioning protein
MLLNLPKEVKDSITESTMNASVAQELIYLQNEEDRSHIAKLIIKRHLTIQNVRKMVKEMNGDKNIEKSFVNYVTRDGVKMQRSFDKTIITLRIAMNRIGSIIDEVDDDWIIYETLMQHKRRLHEQIDILIKQRRKII